MPLVRQCLIVNPNAGSAQQPDLLTAFISLGRLALLPAARPSQATELARQAVAAGCTRIVATGGDGTLNEVLNGLTDRLDDVEVGLIPLGTANDFAREMGIPAVAGEAVAAILGGGRRRIDLARISCCDAQPRVFVNVSAGGFSTLVDEKLDKTQKDWLGSLAYAFSAAKALPELDRKS